MRLTAVLSLPPKFHYWRDFGWGKKRKLYHYNFWFRKWQRNIKRAPIPDHTLSLDQLPPGSRIMDAEQFMTGPLDAMPDELLQPPKVYDHPWPYNVEVDEVAHREPMRQYEIDTRFFRPREDSLVLTNTILESEQLESRPPFEPNYQHIETITRHHEWATEKDSVLVRLPKKRDFPKINISPKAKYGITQERKEVNVLNAYYDFTKTLLIKYYKEQQQQLQQNLVGRRSIAFPQCHVPFERESRKFNLNLCIDSMSLSESPLPIIDPEPERTREKSPIDIHPRTWKSLLEERRTYKPDWTFKLPKDVYPHTILLAARIKRELRDPDEMLSRSIIHAFGLASQFARFKSSVDDNNTLRKPIVIQTIGYDAFLGRFCFTRFQLNTLDFDDANQKRVKNQAWYSGPITDIDKALRYYLDFQSLQ